MTPLVLNRVPLFELPLTVDYPHSLSSIVKFTQKLTAIHYERSHFVLWDHPKTYGLTCSKRSDSGERIVEIVERFYFFALPFYFAPLPTI